jgi:hypothetical protein
VEYDLFVCYSRRDSRFVDRLCQALVTYHVRLWRDTKNLEVGDHFISSITDAIDRSRFFGLVVSPHALKSTFIERVEIRTAMTRAISVRGNAFILPLLLKRPATPLPSYLAGLHHLDFTSNKNFMSNTDTLARRVLLDDERFTGALIYKSIDVTSSGTLIGVGEPVETIPTQSPSFRLYYEDGVVRFMELFEGARLTAFKSVMHDALGRVSEITLYKDNQIVDTWRYIYDEVTGLRRSKLVVKPGQHPHRRIEYDDLGKKVREVDL